MTGLESEGGSSPPACWDFDQRHYSAAEAVSRRINTDADPALDPEDVYQEALVYLATASERHRNLEWHYLVAELQQRTARALNIYNRPLEAQIVDDSLGFKPQRSTSRDYTTGWVSRPTPPEFEGLGYTPALVERALPYLWDQDYGLTGLPSPTAPPADMPKGSAANPKTANTHLAVRADIFTAWDKAPLSRRERQVLLLKFGLDSTYVEIASDLGYADESGARKVADRAVLKIANHLNGTEHDLDEHSDESD